MTPLYRWLIFLIVGPQLHIWPALIMAGASMAGQLMTNRSSARNTSSANQASLQASRETNTFNAAQAAMNRDFTHREAINSRNWSGDEARTSRAYQARMSNTQHQRQVADLRAAGLNPILSANSGAGTPSGAMGQSSMASGSTATGVMPSVRRREQSFGDLGASALASRRMDKLQRSLVKEQARTSHATGLAQHALERRLHQERREVEFRNVASAAEAKTYNNPTESKVLGRMRAYKGAGLSAEGALRSVNPFSRFKSKR